MIDKVVTAIICSENIDIILDWWWANNEAPFLFDHPIECDKAKQLLERHRNINGQTSNQSHKNHAVSVTCTIMTTESPCPVTRLRLLRQSLPRLERTTATPPIGKVRHTIKCTYLKDPQLRQADRGERTYLPTSGIRPVLSTAIAVDDGDAANWQLRVACLLSFVLWPTLFGIIAVLHDWDYWRSSTHTSKPRSANYKKMQGLNQHKLCFYPRTVTICSSGSSELQSPSPADW
jgi:hypothetical protein